MLRLVILLVLFAPTAFSQGAAGNFSGFADGETSFYHGTINQTLEVELTLTRKGDSITGTYEYATHQEPLRLQGAVLSNGTINISEFAASGTSGGQFLLDNLSGALHLDGKWTSADEKRSYEVHLGKIDDGQHRQLHEMWRGKGPIRSIALGDYYGCAVRETGAWCWGTALFMPSVAAAGPGRIAHRALPNLLIPTGTLAISIAGNRTCFLHSGAMKCWQLSSKPAWFLLKPTVVRGFESAVTAIGAGEGFVCGVVQNRLTCWDGTSMNPNDFVTLASGVTALSAGSPRCAIVQTGFRCWTIGVSDLPPTFHFKEEQSVREVVEHVAASEGLVCWTQGTGLQCTADRFRSEADKRVAAGNQFPAAVTDISVARDHSCFIWRNEVYCWGANDYGQLGDGSRQLASPTGVPTRVVLPSRPRQILVANRVSCALTTADEVYCWGADDFGQAGAAAQDSCDMPNGHADAISEPCNLKPVRVPGLP